MPTLNWIGKDKVVNHHQDVPFKVLEHKYGFTAKKGEQSEETNSGNKIINDDNLAALKTLLPEYEGKIDLVYIDPPYNTGNEKWIYNDKVNHPKIKNWLDKVVGKEGEDLTRHDKWLCMMYPRLKLLSKLLSENGVIFISINYTNEHAYLKCLSDEIFGRNNFIGEITWEATTQPINSGSARFKLQQKVEPILFYAKNKKNHNSFILEEIESGFKYPHQGKLGRKCRFEIIEKSDAGGYNRPTMKFEILGQTPREGKRWQIGKDTAIELDKNNRLEIVNGIVKKAVYPEDELEKKKYKPFWSHLPSEQVGTAQFGKELLNEIMGRAVGFDTVKPPALIEKLISYFPSNIKVLDSFAGSGTTAQAVLNLNMKDDGNRKFILIEMEDYANDITAERVKRVTQGYKDADIKVEGLGGEFDYYELGQPIFKEDKNLNEEVGEEKIREYIYYTETKQHLSRKREEDKHKYLLDILNETGYYFYYDKDKLTSLDIETLNIVTEKSEQYIIYADHCLLDQVYMLENNIIFKKIPRDIKRF
jgi:adenine-specific DNA-methyltransferase